MSFGLMSTPRLMRLCYGVTEGDAETDEGEVPIYVSVSSKSRSVGAESASVFKPTNNVMMPFLPRQPLPLVIDHALPASTSVGTSLKA